MNNTQPSADVSLYCGKKVIVSVNGQLSDMPLFIGDGCECCGTGSAAATSWDAVGPLFWPSDTKFLMSCQEGPAVQMLEHSSPR
jgi:hypothetical protein